MIEKSQLKEDTTHDEHKQVLDSIMLALKRTKQNVTSTKTHFKNIHDHILTGDESKEKTEWDTIQRERQINPYLEMIITMDQAVPEKLNRIKIEELNRTQKYARDTEHQVVIAKTDFRNLREAHVLHNETYPQTLETMKKKGNPFINKGISIIEELEQEGNTTPNKHKQNLDSVISNLELFNRKVTRARIHSENLYNHTLTGNESKEKTEWNTIQRERQNNNFLNSIMNRFDAWFQLQKQ